MTPVKPYLVRTFYEWIVDNDLTPYVTVNTTSNLVKVPEQYIQDDHITLDIAPDSVRELLIDNEALSCQAVFDDLLQNLYVPISSIVAIYAQENNQGMAFPPEEFPPYEPGGSEQESNAKPKSKKLNLKVIDGDK